MDHSQRNCSFTPYYCSFLAYQKGSTRTSFLCTFRLLLQEWSATLTETSSLFAGKLRNIRSAMSPSRTIKSVAKLQLSSGLNITSFFIYIYKCQKILKWQSKFKKTYKKMHLMLILQDQKSFESLALKKANGKVTNIFFSSSDVLFCPQCTHWSQLTLRRAYTSKGKFCLSAVQTPIIS